MVQNQPQIFNIGIRCQYLMTCPRGSCVGQNIPPGWFDQKNCCNARNQSYEWVVLHEGWRAQGRDAYEPCISKKEIYFCYYEFNGIQLHQIV